MTAAAVEPISIEHLDEEWAPACELRKPHGCGGERAADWIVRGVRCCSSPKVALWCTGCKEMMLQVPGGILCSPCGELFLPASTAFASIEPLNPGQP